MAIFTSSYGRAPVVRSTRRKMQTHYESKFDRERRRNVTSKVDLRSGSRSEWERVEVDFKDDKAEWDRASPSIRCPRRLTGVSRQVTLCARDRLGCSMPHCHLCDMHDCYVLTHSPLRYPPSGSRLTECGEQPMRERTQWH